MTVKCFFLFFVCLFFFSVFVWYSKNVAADHVMLPGTRSKLVLKKTARECLSDFFCQKSHHDSTQ